MNCDDDYGLGVVFFSEQHCVGNSDSGNVEIQFALLKCFCGIVFLVLGRGFFSKAMLGRGHFSKAMLGQCFFSKAIFGYCFFSSGAMLGQGFCFPNAIFGQAYFSRLCLFKAIYSKAMLGQGYFFEGYTWSMLFV